MDITFDLRLRILDGGNGVLADFKVSIPVEGPFVPMGNLLREAGRATQAMAELWASYYSETSPEAAGSQKWCLQIDSRAEGKEVFQQARTEELPIDFVGRAMLTSTIHSMLQRGAEKLGS